MELAKIGKSNPENPRVLGSIPRLATTNTFQDVSRSPKKPDNLKVSGFFVVSDSLTRYHFIYDVLAVRVA